MSIIEQLAAGPDLIEAAVRDFKPSMVGWTPSSWEAAPAEHFSALGNICHLRDIEKDGYHVRVHRVVAEDKPDLASVDGFALAKERHYENDQIDRALAEFRAARTETIARIRKWSAADFDRTCTFAEYGTLTARGLLHLLASHDLQHLSGLRWLLARASAA
ncbi:MAG: DinB family protein [Myxococcaceae bacterium]